MPKLIDLTGKRFGRLTVIRKAEDFSNGNHTHHKWVCKCDCGKEKIVSGESLRNGSSKSCGCLFLEKTRKHCGSHEKLYYVWNGMKQRCYNKNSTHYKNYGARGISVCNEWKNSYESFRNWAVKNGYKEGLEIDRINNNGNYCPDNCRMITHFDQQSNKRTNKFITFNGETKTLSQWARYLGIKPNSLIYRIKNYGIEKSLSLKGNLRGNKIE